MPYQIQEDNIEAHCSYISTITGSDSTVSGTAPETTK